MNPPKVAADDYIQFLIASPTSPCCTEAARVAPEGPNPPAHDAYNRLLHRLEPDPQVLWEEVRPLIHRKGGTLVLDDTILDKPYARKIELVTGQWSGKHKAVVAGIGLITLLWTDGDRSYPCDYRLYDKSDGLTKNDHFAAMLAVAKGRGFDPECVCFDPWYSSLENLKAIREMGWTWLTRFKNNRIVEVAGRDREAVHMAPISARGTVVHLRGYGSVKVFRIVPTNGGEEYWATNDLGMDQLRRVRHADESWAIENYHRAIKQCCGVEGAQVRAAKAQRNHIGMALRAFVRLSLHFYAAGVSYYEAKKAITREAIRSYLTRPKFTLPVKA